MLTEKLALLPPTLGLILCFYGWGSLLARLVGRALPRTVYPLLGVAAVVILGGPLVAFGLADDLILALVLFAGALVGGVDLYRTGKNWYQQNDASCPDLRPYIVAIAGLIFLFVLYSLPTAFNAHDDLEKYLKYPVRILQTGGLATGPFDTLGVTVLGGMSFVQAMALLLGPLPYVNIIDAVLAPFFAMLLIATAMRHLGKHWLLANAACFALLVLDPMYVNTSAYYLGSAFFLLLLLLPVFTDRVDNLQSWPWVILAAFLYATLASLKTSLALLIPIFYIAWISFGLFPVEKRGQWLLRSWRIPLLSIVLALPWFGVHFSKYWSWWTTRGIDNRDEVVTAGPQPHFDYFSTEHAFYTINVTPLHYTLFLGVIVLLAIAFALLHGRQEKKLLLPVLTATATLVVSFVLIVSVLSPVFAGPHAGMRYVGPLFLVGAIVFAICARSGNSNTGNRTVRAASWLPLLTLIIAFLPSFAGRAAQWAYFGHIVSIPQWVNKTYLTIAEMYLGPGGRVWLHDAQTTIPEGDTVLLWTLGSAHYDYTRNPAFDVDMAGISGHWHDFPFNADLQQQADYLRGLGVDAIIWQYSGPTVRRSQTLMKDNYPARMRMYRDTLDMMTFLQGVSHDPELSRITYDDGMMRVIQLRPSATVAENKSTQE